MTTQGATPQLTHIDRPEVTETFADHVYSILFDGQTFRLELGVTRLEDPTATPGALKGKQYTACRLVLTPTAALDLAGKLNGMLQLLERQGVLKKDAPKPIGPVN